ncbi:MAG: multidrug DMT transporter permease [Acidobacteriota bacterium]|jgi:glucose uptake protein
MFILDSYAVAVVFCVVTMLCWGSWANTQKMVSGTWRFELYYWDYALGVLLLSLIFAFTLGSMGEQGRGFLDDLAQATPVNLGSAFLGGAVFNLANILVVAAIAMAGMAVAFPVGIGLALVLGVIVNYLGEPAGDPAALFLGTALVAGAIVLDALAYKRLPRGAGGSNKALLLAVAGGLLMGFFYRFVAASMSLDFVRPEAGKLTPYTAVVLFSLGLFASNLVLNTILMKHPFAGGPVSFADYRKGGAGEHLAGILGGIIWNVGMSFSIIASGKAGFAISYGLGQGATLVAAIWGVFVWREFRDAPAGTGRLIGLMFGAFVAGLSLIVYARVA